MNLAHLARTLRTLRHLGPSQIGWRLRYHWQRRRPPVAPRLPESICLRDDFPAVPLVAHARGPSGEKLLEQLQQGEFEHLNLRRRLGRQPMDWQIETAAENRLWTATLHYHAWAWELAQLATQTGPSGATAAELLREYLADWLGHCDLSASGSRGLAWNAYTIATRIGWWCRVYHALGHKARQAWGPMERQFQESLWQQAAYLHEHLELDLRGNHLLRDAVGLAWAGRFFAGPGPQRWLATATRLASQQAAEQVLADGGHFERSPMYHVQVMEDFLSLFFLLEDAGVRAQLRETWQRMAEFLVWIRHPDGQVPLLNDSALNGACEPNQVLGLGSQHRGANVDLSPGEGGRYFPEFGLLAWHGGPWSVFFDAGSIGPDCNPGHAHADTLCFEASYQGQRLFVDPGTFGYDNDDRRRYDRATSSHNTICLDDTDSSEVWHIFRVGRRARPARVEVDFTLDGCRITASHSGYCHLPGRPRHWRTLEVTRAGELTITDRIEGSGRHCIEGGLLLAPGWEVQPAKDGWEVWRDDLALHLALEASPLPRIAIQPQPYHPEFGCETSCQKLCWRDMLQLPYSFQVKVRPRMSLRGCGVR